MATRQELLDERDQSRTATTGAHTFDRMIRIAEIDEEVASLDGIDPLWWWLSFADGNRPAGEQFLGAAIVGKARTFGAAVFTTRALGINPGGECQGGAIRGIGNMQPPTWARDRLLTKTEAERCDAEFGVMLATQYAEDMVKFSRDPIATIVREQREMVARYEADPHARADELHEEKLILVALEAMEAKGVTTYEG